MWLLFLIPALIVCVGLGYGLGLYLRQSKIVFQPCRRMQWSPADRNMEYKNCYFLTADGLRLHGWYAPGGGDGPVVLFCHGNGGNVSDQIDMLELLNELALDCFVFDYRGYGKSQGYPSEQGIYDDTVAAYKFLTEQRYIRPACIIVLGKSLGGVVAARLAGEYPVAGLVLEGAFTSCADLAARLYPFMPVRRFLKFKMPTIEYISQAKCPVLVFHSKEDQLVPFEFGRLLYEAAPTPKEFAQLQGSHNDAFIDSIGVYMATWQYWLEHVKSGSR